MTGKPGFKGNVVELEGKKWRERKDLMISVSFLKERVDDILSQEEVQRAGFVFNKDNEFCSLEPDEHNNELARYGYEEDSTIYLYHWVTYGYSELGNDESLPTEEQLARLHGLPAEVAEYMVNGEEIEVDIYPA